MTKWLFRNLQASPHNIGNTVLFIFIVTALYAFSIIALAAMSSGFIGRLLQNWIDFTAPVANALFILAPEPEISNATIIEQINLYRHIITVCGLFALAHFLSIKSYWQYWAEKFENRLHTLIKYEDKGYQQPLLRGYYQMVFGLIAVFFLLLFGENQIGGKIAEYLYIHEWTFVRGPLLIALGYGFACYAAVFKHMEPWPRN